MTNNKSTKRALLSSVVALFLCFAMLLGTTYAWFTDSVTSANNVIKSGNLDIELEYWDGDSWENVAGKSDILTNTLWEPGVTEIAYLRVANAGSLALKYQLGINIVSETAGVNQAGDEFKLSDYIKFGVVEGVNGETGAYANREAAVAAVTDAKALNAGYTKAAFMTAGQELYLALVVYMPTETGNVANHNGTDVPEINLGINVFATQVMAESDSFGPDYDQSAPIVSAPVVLPEEPIILKGDKDVTIGLTQELLDELEAVGNVEKISISVSEPVVDATNNSITFDSVELVDQDGNVIDLESLNLENPLPISLPLPATAPFAEGDTVIVYHDGKYMASATVTDGKISYNAAHLCEITLGAVEAPKVDEDGTVKIGTAAELFGLAQQVNSGKEYYEGKTIVLTADIDLKNSEWTPIGSATEDHGFMGNFDGNGFTIYNLTMNKLQKDADGYVYAGLFGITEGTEDDENVIQNLKIQNVTINTDGHIVSAAIAYPYYTTVKDVTVCGDIAISGGDYTAGVLAYTRRCTTASNLTISGNEGSYIKGRITVGGVLSDIQTNGGIVANYSNFAASNLAITGEKAVGGISGIIGGQTLNGANVKNVALVCSDAHVGIVSGSFDGKPVIADATYSNVTGAGSFVGAPYSNGSSRNVTINGVAYESVATADELVAALEANKNVIFANNIKVDPAKMSNAYGKTGINVKNGQTIDGNGYTLDVKGAGGTWDSGINTTGGLIKNITVTGSFRGIFINHNSTYSEKVVLDNVTLTGVIYTISCDQGLYQGIEATNCTFNGWTSFAKTAGEAKFVNCTFGEGNGYKYCRPYSNTEFVNCTFCEGYAVDTTQATVTFTNCTGLN